MIVAGTMSCVLTRNTLLVLVFLSGTIVSNSGPKLFPFGEVNICPGGTRVFTCQDSVATTSSPVLPMIHWRIQFEEAGLSDVHQSYIPSDPLGDVITDHRSPEYTFTFNLTAGSALHLVSTLVVTLDANSMGRDQTSLGVATVGCNEQNASATLYITTNVPSPPVNLKLISAQGSQQILLQWNASEAADLYFVTVSPSVQVTGSSESSFVTPNTTLQIPVLFNHEYNVSVVASNCAGNSTTAETTMLAMSSGCSSFLAEELTFVSGWISDTCSAIEGSSINIQCSGDSLPSTFTLVSDCSNEGRWKQETIPVTQAHWPSRTTSISGGCAQNSGSSLPPLYALPTASGFSFAFGLLLGIILSVFIMKMQARRKAVLSARKEVPLQIPAPVYEELHVVHAVDLEPSSPSCKVMDNVAYGPVCN